MARFRLLTDHIFNDVAGGRLVEAGTELTLPAGVKATWDMEPLDAEALAARINLGPPPVNRPPEFSGRMPMKRSVIDHDYGIIIPRMPGR
jgi:hypothetical protein